MLIYILVDLVLILLGLMTYQKTKKKYALVLSFIMLLLLAGLRGAFTSDYTSYWNFYLKVKYQKTLAQTLNPFVRFEMEKGLAILFKLLGYVTESPVVVFSILSAMTLAWYYKAFQSKSYMPLLSVLLFVSVGDYYASFNLVRQILASAISFWGLTCWMEGKKKEFFGYLIVAVLIHRTALILVPLLFVLNFRVRTRNMLIYGLLGGALYVLLPTIIRIGQLLFSAYSNYAYGMGSGTINAIIPLLGMLAFIAYSVLSGSTTFDVEQIQNRMLINASVFAVIVMILGLRIYIVSRFAYYLKPAFCILVPNVIAGYKNEKNRRLVLIIICLLAIAFTYITLSGTGYDPYYFVFS